MRDELDLTMSWRRTGSEDDVAEMLAGGLADAWAMILELLRVPEEYLMQCADIPR